MALELDGVANTLRGGPFEDLPECGGGITS